MDIATFDGDTYDPERDGVRLTTQMGRVIDVMRDGKWRTLKELADAAAASEASVSARLRDLRKPRFGEQDVEREYVADGVWRYRVLFTHGVPPQSGYDDDEGGWDDAS